MKAAQVKLTKSRRRARTVSLALGIVVALGLLFFASSASAAYEQVASFAEGHTSFAQGKVGDSYLERAAALSVNRTGAGGVPAGTLYAVSDTHSSVVSFGPRGELREAWGWGVGTDNESGGFQRCGPDGEPAYPTCLSGGRGGEGIGQLAQPTGIAVDQATGDVYVVNDAEQRQPVIEVFSADGSELIATFGDAGAFGETIEEGPEKLHSITGDGIAVNSSGTVYVADRTRGTPHEETRVMVFKPQSPGDYQHYVYTGREHDIAVNDFAHSLSLDETGALYMVRGENDIYRFTPSEPVNPTCEFQLVAGGIAGMTVDPASGEPFYFNYKNRKIHQLSACNAQGEFVETALPIAVTPRTEYVYGLAVNPGFSYEKEAGELRAPGVLYAADGEGHGVGHIFAHPVVREPVVESESVSSVTATTATLRAQIDPKGPRTSYVFQYLTEAEYEANEAGERFAGAKEAPPGGTVLGDGQEALSAAIAVIGLSSDTAYRFRAIATSHCEPEDEEAVCVGVGADASLRTFPAEAPELPDHRAYELVSPVEKHGGETFPLDPDRASCGGEECKPGALAQEFPRQSAPDGEAVVYEGQPFSTTEGANVYNEYISKRTPGGWETTTLAPRLMGSNLQGYKAFKADLSEGILYQETPSLTPEAPREVPNLYGQPTASPATLTPFLEFSPPHRGGELRLAYAGASTDFSRRFFAANDALTGATPFAPAAVDGGAEKKNLYEEVNGGLRLVNVLPGNATSAVGAHFGTPAIHVENYDNSISDLSHAISDDGSHAFFSDEAGQVYVRVNGETTIEVPDSAKFLTASADGSQVLLQDGHIYDLETEATTDLTEGQGGFQGILGQSEDLSHVYFVDTAALTGEEENEYGAKAQAGQYNLYAWRVGSLSYLATLTIADNTNPAGQPGGDWHFSPTERTAQASPDGRWLAFVSVAPLSGYDSEGKAEVFLYDAASGKLSCPSCNPSNARPLGASSVPLVPQLSGEDPQLPARYLLDSGRLYFDSRDSLSPFDTNDGVEDVYQYEPDGIGGCGREGCVKLISAGHEPIDSNFLATDATGKNVFFTTRDRLVLKDRDELFDVYDAREGGGIASETETARGECQGETCQQAASPPSDPTPASSSFEGAGNVNEKKAAKKHHKKRHAHRRHAHEKHHKKRHAHKRHAKKKRSHKRAAKHNRGGAK